jgi:hypothetical protein
MVKHALFLRWMLITGLTVIGSFFAQQAGIFAAIHDTDHFYISHTIITGFFFMTIWCGLKTYKLSKSVESDNQILPDIKNLEEVGWFASGTFMALGMFGTIVGMIVALTGLGGINVSDITSMQSGLTKVIRGMGVALYTTGVGIVCAHLLMFQYFNLGHARRKKKNEKKL